MDVTFPSDLPPWLVPGFGVRVMPRTAQEPAILGLTTHEARSDEEVDAIRARGPRIAAQMREMPGFCGAFLMTYGNRMFSVSGWTDREGPARLNREGEHREAIGLVMNTNFTGGGLHSLWTVDTLRMLVRCSQCGAISDILRTHGRCTRCDADLRGAERYL